MLDVLLNADFARNRTLFFCYSEPSSGGDSTALARAQLSADRTRLEDLKIIFSQKPKVASSAYFGCRIVESQSGGKPDGLLYLTLGDRFSRLHDAQTINSHHGKVVRVHKDGRVPADNPFVNRAGALPEIWSYGHRNLQVAALSPDMVPKAIKSGHTGPHNPTPPPTTKTIREEPTECSTTSKRPSGTLPTSCAPTWTPPNTNTWCSKANKAGAATTT